MEEYGLVLRPAEDFENKELIASLMLFSSTHFDDSSNMTDLDSYIERANDDQDKIYYCVADTHEAAANSPHIEGLKANKKEVLLLTDRIDEWLMATLMNFKGKELVNVAKRYINVDEEKPNISDSDQDFLTKVKML